MNIDVPVNELSTAEKQPETLRNGRRKESSLEESARVGTKRLGASGRPARLAGRCQPSSSLATLPRAGNSHRSLALGDRHRTDGHQLLRFPDCVPMASMVATTSRPSITLPNSEYWGGRRTPLGPLITKNWLPLVFGPALAMARDPSS